MEFEVYGTNPFEEKISALLNQIYRSFQNTVINNFSIVGI